MSYIESKIISLNASDGNTNNSSFLSDIDYNTNNLYKDNDEIINTYIEVSNAQIPVSFYIINYTNNLFRYKINTDPITTYTITTGNYNANQLITILNSIHPNFTSTFDKNTGKITFSHNKPFIIYNDFTYSIGSLLGFNKNTINNSVGSTNPYTLTPPNLLNLIGIKKLNVFSSDLEIHNLTSNINNVSSHTSLICTIPNDAPTYGLINYHNYSNIKCPFNNKNIDSINIQIKDENNNLINFNGISYTLTLVIHIEKKLNILNSLDIYQLLNKYNKPIDNKDQINNELDLLTKK